LGYLPDNTLAFRVTDLARELFAATDEEPSHAAALPAATEHDGPAWVVQPNYDIVVYLDIVSPAQLSFLEQHAERRQAEAHTAHYQLTREAIYYGLEAGTHLNDLLATLRSG